MFICGGAFVGLDKIIEKRTSISSLGFNSNIENEKETKMAELISQIQPQDLIKFGLIPEFVGRLPIVVGLNELDLNALVKIMIEPKNAIIKQYQTMFKLDGVELEFTEEAIRAVASKSIKLKTGARGLRTILETSMLDLMFKTPGDKQIKKIILDKGVINGKEEPTLIKKEELNKIESA